MKKIILLLIGAIFCICMITTCGNDTSNVKRNPNEILESMNGNYVKTNSFRKNVKKMPNGTLEDLTEKYLLSYTRNSNFQVDDFSSNFNQTLKGTESSVGEAVKILAEEKAKTLILSKNDINFIDTRVIDADGKGRYIVAMMRKDNKGFANAYLALVELDENTGMCRTEAHYHGEFFIGENNVSGSYGLNELYEKYTGKNWGTKVSIKAK